MKKFPLVTLHSDMYQRRFIAKKHTTGYIFLLIVCCIVLAVPFMTTYASGSKLTLGLIQL